MNHYDRMIRYRRLVELMRDALMEERRSFDLTREAVDLRAQNVAARIIDEMEAVA